MLYFSARGNEDEMCQAVEAIVCLDGRVGVREAVRATTPRSAILHDPRRGARWVQNAAERPLPSVREALGAAGLLVEVTFALQPRSETERATLLHELAPGRRSHN